MNTNLPNWSALDQPTAMRCVLWAHVLSELIEIVALLEIENQSPFSLELASSDLVFSDGSPSCWPLMMRHLRQHLATKVASMFKYSGDQAKDSAVPVSENKMIKDWIGPINSHAHVRGAEADLAVKLIERLCTECDKLVKHKDGYFADFSVTEDGSPVFRTWLPPLTSDELDLLKLYFCACRDFVICAALFDGRPAFPYDLQLSRYNAGAGLWENSTHDLRVLLLARR